MTRLWIFLLVFLCGSGFNALGDEKPVPSVGPIKLPDSKPKDQATDPILHLIHTSPANSSAPAPIIPTEEENALIPKFLAPLKWGVKRGDITTLRPKCEIDEDPIGFGSDRREYTEEFSIEYGFNGRHKSVDEPLHSIQVGLQEGLGLETHDPPVSVQAYRLLRGALAKYGKPDEVRTYPWFEWENGVRHPTDSVMGILLWRKGHFTVVLNGLKHKDGKFTSAYAGLCIYHQSVAEWYDKFNSLKTSTPDPEGTFLTPQVLADIAASPTTWE